MLDLVRFSELLDNLISLILYTERGRTLAFLKSLKHVRRNNSQALKQAVFRVAKVLPRELVVSFRSPLSSSSTLEPSDRQTLAMPPWFGERHEVKPSEMHVQQSKHGLRLIVG